MPNATAKIRVQKVEMPEIDLSPGAKTQCLRARAM